MTIISRVGSLDGGVARIAAILMPLIGGMPFVIQPGFVQGLVTAGGFSEREAGLIASAEMTGFAVSAISVAIFASRWPRQRVISIALALSTIMNIVSLFVPVADGFAAVRFVAGIGSGAAMSLGFAAIGMTRQAERNFGWNIALSGLVGAVVMSAVPMALRAFGLHAIIAWFVAWNLLGLSLTRFMPRSGHGNASANPHTIDVAWTLKAPALGAILIYFTAQGAVWAYLFLIGTSGGIAEQAVANGLMLSGIAGIAGGFTAVVFGSRFTRTWALTIGVVAGIIPMVVLADVAAAAAYTIAVCVYNFAWNMTHPYLLATYAALDRDGRLVVYAAAFQTIGMALGPAVGAAVISPGHYANVAWTAIVLFVVTLLLVLPAAYAATRGNGRRSDI
jgi:predicted MFS family arabinose efflux permease